MTIIQLLLIFFSLGFPLVEARKRLPFGFFLTVVAGSFARASFF
jgi:hypothetical protein